MVETIRAQISLSRNLAMEGVGERDHGGWKIKSQEKIFKFRLRKFKCVFKFGEKKILEKRIMKKQKREGKTEEVTEEEGLWT